MKITLDSNAYVPTRDVMTQAALILKLPRRITLAANGFTIIDTGVHVEIPSNMTGVIDIKPWVADKYGIMCNTFAIFNDDNNFIKIKVFNPSEDEITLPQGLEFATLNIQLSIPSIVSIVSPKPDTQYTAQHEIGDRISKAELLTLVDMFGTTKGSQLNVIVGYFLNSGKLCPVYPTFNYVGNDMWEFVGNCFEGEYKEPNNLIKEINLDKWFIRNEG